MKRTVISRLLLSAVSLVLCMAFTASCRMPASGTPQTTDPSITAAARATEESPETTARVTSIPANATAPVDLGYPIPEQLGNVLAKIRYSEMLICAKI